MCHLLGRRYYFENLFEFIYLIFHGIHVFSWEEILFSNQFLLNLITEA